MKENTTTHSPFSKLVHVAIVVRDLDEAAERLESLGIGPFKAVSVPPHRRRTCADHDLSDSLAHFELLKAER